MKMTDNVMKMNKSFGNKECIQTALRAVSGGMQLDCLNKDDEPLGKSFLSLYRKLLEIADSSKQLKKERWYINCVKSIKELEEDAEE